MAQEQSRATAERAQKISEQAMMETKELQLAQQTTTAEIKRYVADIGFKIQEQAERTLLQERTSKEAQERATEQLSQCMQAKVDATQQQAVDATQLAVQAQSVAQYASANMSAYEPKMKEVESTVS